jgi:hypothetical protein
MFGYQRAIPMAIPHDRKFCLRSKYIGQMMDLGILLFLDTFGETYLAMSVPLLASRCWKYHGFSDG